MEKEKVISSYEKTNVKKAQEANKDFLKNEWEKLKEVIKSDYLHFFKAYKDKLPINYHPLSTSTSYPRKDFTDFFSAMRQVWIAVWVNRYNEFMEFIKDKDLFLSIKDKINSIGGIKAGHSYIIISRDSNVLKNIATLLVFELTYDVEKLLIPSIKVNYFDFIKLAKDLEQFEKKFHSEEDPMEEHEHIGGDIYYDIVKLNIGTTFPSDEEEKKIFSYINNRMLTLMNSYKDKGMIITTGNPLPFFEERIKEGVEKLHVLDLRNIESNPVEQVEME